MTGELFLGVGIGTGALAGAWWAQAKWEAWKQRLAVEYGTAHLKDEEQAMGRLALITLRACRPDFELINKRLGGIEKELYKLTLAALEREKAAELNQTEQLSSEPPAYSWRNDEAAREIAREVVASLVKMGQKRPEAEQMVERALNRIGEPGLSHDQLFSEAFKK